MSKKSFETSLKVCKGSSLNHNQSVLKVQGRGKKPYLMNHNESALKVSKGMGMNYKQTTLKVRKGFQYNHNQTALKAQA